MQPREATIEAMQEVSGPVIATSLVLFAVFVPVAFMGGITGRLYQQFAITIAVSVAFSSVNALSLSPALASKLLKPKGESKSFLDPFYRWFNRVFEKATGIYVAIAAWVVRRWVLGLVSIAALMVGVVWLGGAIPAGFVPEEDQGYILINVQLPDAASLQRADEVCGAGGKDSGGYHGDRKLYDGRRVRPALQFGYDQQRGFLHHARPVGGSA